MQNADILIIGQGIAGTCLAFALIDRGLSVHIVDNAHATASSMVSTAVINPVTGRRYAKSWEIDKLIPGADVFYNGVSAKLGKQYLTAVEISQIIPDDRVEEIWMLRSSDVEFQPYLNHEITDLEIPGIRKTRIGRIRNARHLEISEFIGGAALWFRERGLISEGNVEPGDIKCEDDGIDFRGIGYRHAVFCQGYLSAKNPYFTWLEVYPMKGEYLICRIPGLRLSNHVKSNVSLIPLPEPDHYWCGSTYDRYNDDPSPSSAGRQYLLSQLAKFIDLEVTVEHHGVGIRATTRDRRPYVGVHPEFHNLHLITGLGTKGASLAPYCAQVLADQLAGVGEIPDEVDILRHTVR